MILLVYMSKILNKKYFPREKVNRDTSVLQFLKGFLVKILLLIILLAMFPTLTSENNIFL